MSLKLKRSLITILSAFVLLFASLAIFVASSSPIKVNAEVIEVEVEGVDDNYIYNAKVDLPESVTHNSELFYGGIIIYPNGTAYEIDDGIDGTEGTKNFTLDEVGKYTLRYFGDGNSIAEKTFAVTQKHFVLSVEEEAGKNEIVNATEELMAGQLLPQGTGNYPDGYEFKQYDNNTSFPNIEQNLTMHGKEALIVRMGAGAKLTYSVPIDLTNASADGLTDIIRFQPRYADMNRSRANSSANYAIETIATHLYITLTDCYDSSRYMKFTLQCGGDTNYARTGTDNLIDAGWVFPTSRTPTPDMSYKDFYEGTEYGFAYIGSYGTGGPGGYTNEWGERRDSLSLRFDYENAKVWVASTNPSGGDYITSMITDFKHEAIYPAGGYRGFTTGEVYLSVEFANYNVPEPARIDIYEIAGSNASDLFELRNADVSGSATNLFKDTKAPLINLDFSATNNDGVFVDVGTQFVVPSAQCYDVNLKGYTVNAYRNYYDEQNRSRIAIVDGKLPITMVDTYYIVYTAEDTYGNVTEKIIKVFAEENQGNKAINFDYGNKITGVTTGLTSVLPKFTFSTRNNLEDRKVKIILYSDNESMVLADLKSGQEIDEFLAMDKEFLLSYGGTYTIEYIYSDNAVSGVASYQFESTPSDDVITFPKAPVLPRYLIKDATYDFDEVWAYSFASGSEQPYAKAEAYIAYDDDINLSDITSSTFTKLDSLYDNTITGSDKAVLKYVYDSKIICTEVVQIVDVNIGETNNKGVPTKLKQYKYFVGDFATAHPDDDSYDADLFPEEVYYPVKDGEQIFDSAKLDYKSKVRSGDNTLKFANIIDVSEFGLYYRILDNTDPRQDADNFNALKLVFTDPYNTENQVFVKLYKQNNSVYVNVNDEIMQRVNQAFSGNIDKSFTYNISTGLFAVSGVTARMPFTFDFTTTKAYLDIVFEDISGVAGIRIVELNGHKFSHDGRARTLPTALMTLPQGTYKEGTIITINPADYVDVLSPIIKSNVSIKVVSPTGNVVTALDGTVLDGECDPYKSYKIELTEKGQYEVLYTAKNGIAQTATNTGYITVGDLTPPEITFKGGITEGCIVYLKPKQIYTVKYSVQDETSLTENIYVKIIWANRELSCASVVLGNDIYFLNEGEYIVGISCCDEAGNFARKTFTVIVTNEEVK